MKRPAQGRAFQFMLRMALLFAFAVLLIPYTSSSHFSNARAMPLFPPPPPPPSQPPTATPTPTPTLPFGPIYMPSVGHTFPAMGLCIPAGTRRETARLVRVVDGDTIDVEVRGETKVGAIHGVDTPEYHEPYYEPAKKFNRTLVEV